MPDHLGRLGAYEVVDRVGQGAMGVVYKGHDAALNRYVAIKVLAPQWASDRPRGGGSPARRRRPRPSATRTSSPSTPSASGAAGPSWSWNSSPGVSLQQRIDERGPLELKELLRIGVQVASGLAAAHAQGLIHRDIKPSNIMLENELARVKITDFGLARAVDDCAADAGRHPGRHTPRTWPRSRPGASRWTADRTCSAWGACSTRWRPGWRHSAASRPSRSSAASATASPRRVRELNPEVPDWLAEIIERLHAKAPADRFQSAGEVADLLERHLARLQDPSLPPVEHPWRRRPSRLAAIGRDLARRAGAGRLAIPLLLLAVAAGSAAWTRWAMQAPPAATDPAPRAVRPAQGGLGIPLRLPRRPIRLPMAPPRAERAARLPGQARSPRAPDRDPAEDGLPGRRGLHALRRPRRLRGHRLVRGPQGRPAPRGRRRRPRAVPPGGRRLGPLRLDGPDAPGRSRRAPAPGRLGREGRWPAPIPGARDRTDLKAGRFRIARAGSTVHYLVAAKDSDAFREVGAERVRHRRPQHRPADGAGQRLGGGPRRPVDGPHDPRRGAPRLHRREAPGAAAGVVVAPARGTVGRDGPGDRRLVDRRPTRSPRPPHTTKARVR